jgi:histidinol-phosphate aminotransferase
VLRTFSKAFGLPGLRIGYAIGNPELISVLERIRTPFNVNSLAQVAAEEALLDRDYLREVVTKIRKGREYLSFRLSSLGIEVLPSDANFLMANVSSLGTDAPTLCNFLAKRGILIRDLSKFRGTGTVWVRITVGTEEQNEKLIQALEEFKEKKECK